MATQEYLLRYIESSSSYEELPSRLKLVINEEEWAKRVREYSINQGLCWEASPARRVCDERTYYERLLQGYRQLKRIFPHHLGEYVCRVLRVTPFSYYKDILADSMRDDKPYDSIPNFTAADALKVVGVGRNQYISIMQQAKSKKLMWRMNKGLVKDLLPQLPIPQSPAPWWRVCVVNLGEVEYRTMSSGEAEVCRMAANYADGAPYSMLDAHAVLSLYTRGLVWYNIPISPDDQVSIPPLEGFVSNKTSSTNSIEGIDPLETLLYHIFVAASDRVRVTELADILSVPVNSLQVAISVACRLGFCKKLLSDADSLSSPKSFREAETDIGSPESTHASLDTDAVSNVNILDTAKSKGGVAFVVDSEITGFLMMGALTPDVKRHSVTLFEGGRVYGTEVIQELVQALEDSVEIAKDFEGEMAALACTAASVAMVLKSVLAHDKPVELLRKESMESLTPEATRKILSHAYDVIIPAAALPYPPLPCGLDDQAPTNFGPLPISLSPWMNLALYQHAGMGPKSLVLPSGYILRQVPPFVSRDSGYLLVWPWNSSKSTLKTVDPFLVTARTSLAALNNVLSQTAVMIQPLELESTTDDPESPCPPQVLQVPLPLEGSEDNDVFISKGYNAESGEAISVRFLSRIREALHTMGVDRAIGVLKLLKRQNGYWVPLSLNFGIALSPTPLCEAICTQVTRQALLSDEGCRQQREGQKLLAQQLDSFIKAQGASFTIDSKGNFLPVRIMQMDEHGNFFDEGSLDVIQGAELGH